LVTPTNLTPLKGIHFPFFWSTKEVIKIGIIKAGFTIVGSSWALKQTKKFAKKRRKK